MHSASGAVIGAGPNGLAGAITLARAGQAVTVFEANATVGGGTRSAELTLPGFVHDLCSAVHPMAVASPFFRDTPLDRHGLEWIHPPHPLAHPFDDGTAAVVHRSLEETCESMGADGAGYRRLIGSVASDWNALEPIFFGPVGLPRHPAAAARFGLRAMRSAARLSRQTFQTAAARAVFAGLAAHSTVPLEWAGSAAVALVLGAAAHVGGWPLPRGGAQSIADAMAGYLRAVGGSIQTERRVRSLAELTEGTILADVTPRALADIAGERMPAGYRRMLRRFRRGPGVFKLDWALSAPIPWTADSCRRAGTIHVGGTAEEIEASERAAFTAEPAERPFVLVTQPSLFDPGRAPAGCHTAWAYCHVPNGCTVDMTARIEAQIERFAPGFGQTILATAKRAPADLEEDNANLLGGDISGGLNSLRQLLLRPSWRQYGTPIRGLYLCSSSTPPGGGVHGMCGVQAARRALRTK